MERWEVAVVHAFKGKRFENGHLDVDVAPELKAYRDLVMDVAKSLWQRENSDRQRLPRQFERKFQLRLSKLSKGSTEATLSRNEPAKRQLHLLGGDDIFARAMRLVEESVTAASKAEALPAEFPRTALARFRRWGVSLSDDERIEIRMPDGSPLATYDTATRASLLANRSPWQSRGHSEGEETVCGEARQRLQFCRLQLDGRDERPRYSPRSHPRRAFRAGGARGAVAQGPQRGEFLLVGCPSSLPNALPICCRAKSHQNTTTGRHDKGSKPSGGQAIASTSKQSPLPSRSAEFGQLNETALSRGSFGEGIAAGRSGASGSGLLPLSS